MNQSNVEPETLLGLLSKARETDFVNELKTIVCKHLDRKPKTINIEPLVIERLIESYPVTDLTTDILTVIKKHKGLSIDEAIDGWRVIDEYLSMTSCSEFKHSDVQRIIYYRATTESTVVIAELCHEDNSNSHLVIETEFDEVFKLTPCSSRAEAEKFMI